MMMFIAFDTKSLSSIFSAPARSPPPIFFSILSSICSIEQRTRQCNGWHVNCLTTSENYMGAIFLYESLPLLRYQRRYHVLKFCFHHLIYWAFHS